MIDHLAAARGRQPAVLKQVHLLLTEADRLRYVPNEIFQGRLSWQMLRKASKLRMGGESSSTPMRTYHVRIAP